MVTLQLDPAKEHRLRELAQSQGQSVQEFARHILEEYVDLQGWAEDTPEAWAAVSVNLAAEVLPQETWPEEDMPHGPR